MKKKALFLLSLLLIALSMLALTSCKDGARTPENLTVDFWEASWDAVEGAEEYVVALDGEEYRTKDTTLELFEYVSPGEEVTVRVEPVFALGVREGLWSDEVIYTAESVTEGLVYTDLNNGTYAVSCPADVELINGELVLPDMYEDFPVVEFRNKDNRRDSISIELFGDKNSNYDGPEASEIKKVRLPSQLKMLEKGAFYKAKIEKIYIPDSVTRVGISAFEKCENLTKITGANEIAQIDSYAFCGCSSLSDFSIPETVTTIGAGAFNSSAITKAIIPSGIKILSGYTFYNCTALTEIILPETLDTLCPGNFEKSAWYDAQPDGVVYLGNFLYGYKGTMPQNTKIVIPEGITNMVLKNAFRNQRNLISVTFPEGFTEINKGSFYGCKNLTEVNLPEGLTAINNESFYGCKKLTQIQLPSTLKSIHGGAFYDCGLEQIVLPENLILLGASADISCGAMEACTNLREIVIPNSVTTVGSRCFYGCTNLAKVKIGNSVKNIGVDTFLYCSSLTELTIPESVTSFRFDSIAYTAIEQFVFPKNLDENPFYKPKHEDGILLEYLVIQKDTKLLDFNWFYIYSSLKTFYFEGTQEEYWQIKKIKGANSSSTLSSNDQNEIYEWESHLTVYFYSETKPEKEGNFWHYVDGVPAVW